jgi:hypothetical protein
MFNTMVKGDKTENGYPNYARTLVSRLKRSRKGKHHELMGRIMEDLKKSPPTFAVCVPLSSVKGVSVLNLRSAIVRVAHKAGIRVSTSSDNENFYVWKAQT